LLVLLGPILLYLAAAVLFPSIQDHDESLDDHLIRQRRPFFLLMAAYVAYSSLYSWFLLNSELKLVPMIFRLTAFMAFCIMAKSDERRIHVLLGLAIFGAQLWFTYLFTFVVAAN
jgi:hypothetical protein